MNFGHTKTKLDYIMELGFRRMDEAVERLCDIYTWDTPVPEPSSEIYDHKLRKRRYENNFFAAVEDDRMAQAQGHRNYEAALQAERAALAPRPNWVAMGCADIGNQLI